MHTASHQGRVKLPSCRKGHLRGVGESLPHQAGQGGGFLVGSGTKSFSLTGAGRSLRAEERSCFFAPGTVKCVDWHSLLQEMAEETGSGGRWGEEPNLLLLCDRWS